MCSIAILHICMSTAITREGDMTQRSPGRAPTCTCTCLVSINHTSRYTARWPPRHAALPGNCRIQYNHKNEAFIVIDLLLTKICAKNDFYIFLTQICSPSYCCPSFLRLSYSEKTGGTGLTDRQSDRQSGCKCGTLKRAV